MNSEFPKVQIVINLSGTGYALSGWDCFMQWANQNDALWHYLESCCRQHCLQEPDVIKMIAYSLLAVRHEDLKNAYKQATLNPNPPVIRF